jgi:outer membrane protein assembly factor BamE (lipoprotein component of BamABCDE complex)
MRTSLILSVLLGLSACSPIIDYHGKKPEAEQLTQLKSGQHTKEDVLHILGSPTTQSTFGEDCWYYISETTESKAFLAPEIAEEKMYVLVFDGKGYLKEIRTFQGEQRQLVENVDRITPTHGYSRSILEQIFGNFGRISRSK